MFFSFDVNRSCTGRLYFPVFTILRLAVLCFIGPATVAQTTYYVAGTGNDANNGTSAATPFQSLNKVSNLPLQPGDSVLFRRGDTFRGTLVMRQSGSASRALVYDAYGSGAKPVLAGSVPVTNWSNIGGNVWQANCPSCGNSVTGLYRNGVSLPLGRYPNLDAPNKGYLTIRAHTNNYQIFSVEPFPDNLDFNGAEVVIRPTQWILNRGIVGHEYHPDVLNITYNSGYGLSDGWGYFLQSHPSTLDQNGEWYYDSGTKNFQIYSNLTNINSQLITATVQGRVIDAINASYITLKNLHITETLNQSILAINASNFTLINNDITNSGEDGVSIQGYSNNLTMLNNTVVDVNNNGVYLDAIQNVVFTGNRLRRIGLVAGRGKSEDGQYNGMQSNANQNVLIQNNVIDSVGYNGLQFWNNTTIKQNVISNYCMTKSDGGGLYVFNSQKNTMANIHIISNIIYNGIGAPEGSFRQEYSGANGIFLDDCVYNVELKDNTTFNNRQWGFFLHAINNITVTGNTGFNNTVSQFAMYHDAGYCRIRSNTVKNNIFVTKQVDQLAGQYESDIDDLFQYGVIDSNYYARPFNEESSILAVKNAAQGGLVSVKNWSNFSNGLDLNSKSSPITYNQYKTDGAGGTNRINSPFDNDLDGWYMVYSNHSNAQATLDNTNKLDGNSLRVEFNPLSGQTDSYAQAGKKFGTITKGKTYVLRFDAVASTNVNLLAYLRTSGPPYQEYDRRYTVAIGTTRKSYEFVFTATDTNSDAILLFQIDGEGPVFWLDNLRLQEGIDLKNNPDDLIKFYYNPTLKDTVFTLPAGNFRDVKSQLYSNSLTLKPFTSVILLRDTLPVAPADLSLSMQVAKRVLNVNEPTAIQLRVSNQSNATAALARWTYRLPANLQFIDTNGQPYSDNVLTGTVQRIPPLADTTFIVSVKPTAPGLFRTAAQLTTATSYDPDSRPNTGTADGEDDAATAELLVGGPILNVFESPSVNPRVLPAVAGNQPIPVAGQADLSLRMEVSRRLPAVGEVITCTLFVTNAGGADAGTVQLQDQLPAGLAFVSSPNWTPNGQLLSTTIGAVTAGATVSTSFQLRVTQSGVWSNQAQINASNVADPDSTPGNGFLNGEDDRAQTDVRGQ